MKYKVVIVEKQNLTDMTVSGTVYFETEACAREFVAKHNATEVSRAYVVTVAANYQVIEKIWGVV